MNPVDLSMLVVYTAGLLGVGFYQMRRNKEAEDYYVGGRKMGSWHIGFSVVATDVGGGFSIGLGGLGFAMGLSGSWMLFTGLLGAWLAAVLLIPRIKRDRYFDKALTFPDLFRRFYDGRVALVAGVISAIGYLGFTSAQILAGAKLANGTFPSIGPTTALWIMGSVAVVYTVVGGLKAVIYTDTVQWAVLLLGLSLVGLPVCYHAVGGWNVIRETLKPEMVSLTSIPPVTFFNWMITILPIWFVGMTLYQRIYACRDEKTARKAWYIAGLFEWPCMAFLGVTLGLLGRVAADQGMFAAFGITTIEGMDPEHGLPMLLRSALPVGVMGLVIAAYFSAILSTADSCLMACSGNLVADVLRDASWVPKNSAGHLRFSQVATLILGLVALGLASLMTSVLDLMLYSYAFMVSGLLVPVLGALFLKRRSPAAALAAMVTGGATTVALTETEVSLWLGLDPNVFGIAVSALAFWIVTVIATRRRAEGSYEEMGEMRAGGRG